MANMIDPQMVAFADGMRTNYRTMMPTAGSPDPVAEVRPVDIFATNPARNIPARLYLPLGTAGRAKLPLVLFAHGGGFVSGDLDTHDVMVRAMANRVGAIVISIDYRLAPEWPFPAGLEDVYATLLWASEHAEEIGGDASQIAVSGDSAGANLAAVSAILSRDRGGPKICAQWLMYPTVSNKMDTPSWQEFGDTNFPTRQVNTGVIAAYVPEGTSPYTSLVAPLWAEHKDLPPALVQVGELDPLRDENLAYAQALARAGVEAKAIVYEGQQHGFIQFYKDVAANPRGESALDDGAKFLRSKFSFE